MVFNFFRVRSPAIVLGSLVTILWGCGGSNSSVTNNPYKASYKGEFLDSSGNITSVSLVISGSGAITGTDTNGVVTNNLSGSITSAGVATIISEHGTFNGPFGAPTTSTISAVLNNLSLGATVYATLVLNPATVPTTGNPFAGAYAGTDQDTTRNLIGPLALTVDSTGAISGTILVVPNGFAAFAPLSGTISNGGAISISATLNGTVVSSGSGTVSLANSVLTGSLISNNTGDTISLSLPAVN